MNNPVFIWYPKCSTCQKARAWLTGHGISIEERDIKTQTPTAEEMASWISGRNLPVKKLYNTSGMLYRSMGLKDKLPAMSEEEILALLSSDGMLIKRPVLVLEDQVLTGFREGEWAKALGVD